jgi:hypothetical protein
MKISVNYLRKMDKSGFDNEYQLNLPIGIIAASEPPESMTSYAWNDLKSRISPHARK